MTASRKKVAIVTAASKGMGAACARRLKSEGYELSLFARSPEIQKLGDELGGIVTVGSVTSVDDLDNLVQNTLDAYSRIDVVVNNTGHTAKGPLLGLTDDQWKEGVDILLMNVIRMARMVTPAMKKQRSGSIINISSYAAKQPDLRFPISSAIRAALSSYSVMYAHSHATFGIRMNNVLPGFINSYPVDDDLRDTIPAGREGTVQEIAAVVSFLASDDAAYVNGQDIIVDGALSKAL